METATVVYIRGGRVSVLGCALLGSFQKHVGKQNTGATSSGNNCPTIHRVINQTHVAANNQDTGGFEHMSFMYPRSSVRTANHQSVTARRACIRLPFEGRPQRVDSDSHPRAEYTDRAEPAEQNQRNTAFDGARHDLAPWSLKRLEEASTASSRSKLLK